jgi:HD-GYP domain-containing protein (c-di-GMP phosphodiesterase class II)/DNA-binding CsgD family transcriptional regulator
MGMSEATQLALFHICETWNGKGPHKLKGDDIPLPGRIVNTAMITEVFFSERGVDAAREAAGARKGKMFDPAVAAAVAGLCDDTAFWEAMEGRESWASVLDLEPAPARYVEDDSLDAFAYALADIVDLKSATTATHSRRTSTLAESLAKRLKLSDEDTALARRAALVHDVGLVAVPTLLLEKGTPWSEADFERFRLHTYYTERILSRSECLRPIGDAAASHHEDVDGSGYHRGLSAGQMSLPARVVAAASAFVDAAERTGGDAEQVMASLRSGRKLDPDCLAALGVEAGAERVVPRRTWPAGLTDREVEVLRLVASGRNLKQTAERLTISDHTARHHVESIYSKAGVSSRAGLTLFAVENGLLA